MIKSQRQFGSPAGFVGAAPVFAGVAIFCALAALGAVVAVVHDQWEIARRHVANPKVVAEWVLSAQTAALGFMTSLRIHVHGRDIRWRIATLGSLFLWQGASLYNCWDEPLIKAARDIFYSRTPELFLFIVAMSIPLVAAMFWLVRSYRKSVDWPVAAAFGVGVAAISVWTLLFFVPFDMNFADWGTRLAAIGLVVGGAAYSVQFFPRAS